MNTQKMEVLKQDSTENTATELLLKDTDQFVTVVSVGTDKNYENVIFENIDSTPENSQSGFVTVLTIGDEVANEAFPDNEVVEEVLVYRLPGERLGFGLKFEGGTKTTECVRRLFIQSCASDSPASRVKCSWGTLVEGDEIIKIDSYSVKNMTRIDCVRCLKDSNVVIQLLVKHSQHKSEDFITDAIVPLNSDEDLSSEESAEKKRGPPPPPPIPPRKLSRKLLKDKNSTNIPQPSVDIVDVDAQIISKTNSKVQYPKSAPRTRQHLDVPPKVPSRDRKLSDVSSGPPDAEVYLDLLAQELEYGIKTESESDDTGSTISTVIDKHSSIFLTSNPSSIASDSIPSTPTAVQKQMDLSKVVNPFEMLEMEYAADIQPNDDFLFTRFVSSHDILREYEQTNNLDNRISDCEKTSLTPPANFQDAPLSYGNEDVSTITNHNENPSSNGISEPKESNNDDTEEFEHRIVEEIKVPKPVPRKCYAKKKVEPEEILESLGPIEDVDDSTDTVDFNLPRLVNFVPKILPKSSMSEMRYSFSDPDLQMKKEDSEYHNLCLMKYNHHSDDFNYLYPNSSDYIECNNNECDKILSCSSWSLHNQLATIGESEEEMDSLENKPRYDDAGNTATFPKATGDKNLSEKEEDKLYPILSVTNSSDNDDIEEPLHYASDKRILINNSANENAISSQENFAMICENEPVNQENEIPAIHLVQNGDESAKEDKKEVDAKSNPKNTEISETMEVSNFIQSEQQHAITTSEYSSLSSLSSPPLSFSSRLPPDGQEFPPTCQETQTRSDHQDTLVTTKCDPLPASQMKISVDTRHVPPSSSSSPSWVKTPTEPREFNLVTTRSSLWRKDRSSAGSVKDKIAIFNSGENSEPLLPLTKTYKSSENISVDKSDLYNKKNKFSKSCLCVNNIPSTPNGNQNQFSNNSEENNGNQKELLLNSNKKEDTFEFTKPSLNYASSFSTKPSTRLHSRSQSLLDMSSLDAPWNNPDSRRLTLNTLIEQRRRGLSKLRGLVIPQSDVPVADPVLDLPEIRSKESSLVSQVSTNRSKSENLESLTLGHQRSNSTSLQSPSWKNNSISNLPRYSPAFKRKCLQVYVMEQSSSGPISNNNCSPKTPDSVFHSDYETNTSLTSASLNSIPNDDVFTKNNFSDNQKVESAKSIENMTSPSNSEISFEYSYQSTNSNNSIEVPNENNYYAKKTCQVPKVKADAGRSEEDSDNDSAVSSSQSSYISRECSPLPSPHQDYTNNTHLIPASEAGSDRQALPKSKDLFAAQSNNATSRVLKPQSVEAINRKNILASAKCRSGRDFKNGSPLIQRKLNGSDEEKIVEEQKLAEEVELPTDKEKVSPVETNGNNDEDDTDKQSTSSSSESASTESIKSKEFDNIEPEIKYCDTDISNTPENNPKLPVPIPVPEIKPVVQQPAPANEIEKVVLRNTSKLNTTNVQLRHSVALPATRKYSFDALDRPSNIHIPSSSRHDANKRASVTDIRKQFEKFEQENIKSPVIPEPKSPVVKSLTKNTTSKSATAKSPVESKVFTLNVSPVKEIKTIPKNDVKPFNDVASANISPEELEQIIKEVNEGIDKNSELYVNQNEVIIVVLHREIAGGSIGITLTGGTDYEAKEITVHKVLTGSCAHKDGRLKKGDRILSINGKKMLGLTHKESIDILKDPKPEVSLVVLPYKGKMTPVSTSIRKASSEVSIAEENTESPPPLDSQVSKESLIRVELIKDGAGLGFSLDGGRDSPKGDKPLIIKKIFTGGSAEKCGQLLAGDELIEVNAVEVLKMTRIEVWSMMKKLPDGKVSLTIRR